MAVSPDGGSLAVIQDGTLRKLGMDGSASTELATGASGALGSLAWLDDGTIVFVTARYAGDQSRGVEILALPAGGGDATSAWASDSLFAQNLTPLPGGRALFMACPPPCHSGTLMALDPRSGEARAVAEGAVAGFYADGVLVFVRTSHDVFAASFDPDELEMRGEPLPLPYQVQAPAGQPTVALSASGTLVIGSGGLDVTTIQELIWVDRTGRPERVDSAFTFRVTQFAGDYGWALSPGGDRLAIGLNTPSGDDVWIKSLPRGPASLLTHGASPDRRPRWTPDGRWVTFLTDTTFAMRRADGTGTDSILWKGKADEGLLSPDGQWILLRRGAASAAMGGRDVYALHVGEDSVPQPLLAQPYDEMAIALSPDGRSLAYQSNETGRLEVFVRPFPDVGAGKVQVSSAGGTGPLWARDGRELYYLRGDKTMMAVPVAEDGTPEVGETTALFKLAQATRIDVLSADYYTPWDVAADGRFIMIRAVDTDAGPRTLIVAENWLQEVKPQLRR